MQMPECNGRVCLYTCRDFADLVGSIDERSIIVPYYYEIYVPTTLPLDLRDVLREVESLMLQYTARRLGLEGCDVDASSHQFDFDVSIDWIYNDIAISTDDAIIGSIASAPADTVDGSKDRCTISSIDEAPEDTICFPINGLMKVKYAGEEAIAIDISKSIINMIGHGMSEDEFTTEWIEKIDFAVIGKDIITTDLNDVDQMGGSKGGGGSSLSRAISGAGLGIIISACAAVIVGTALLIRKTLRGKKKLRYIRTPSPNAGKKSGLRAYDSESVRADFNDVSFSLESCERTQIDPYELDPEAPSFMLETNLNNMNKNTALSTISEASKETGSTVFAGIGSPPSSTMQSFTRILSESTYSDGVHSLNHSEYDEDVEDDEYAEPETLFGEQIQSPTPTKSRER